MNRILLSVLLFAFHMQSFLAIMPLESRIVVSDGQIPSTIISDEAFGRMLSEEEIQDVLDVYPGVLRNYSFINGEYRVRAAKSLEFFGEMSGVSPTVIITLMELKSRVVTDESLSPDALDFVFGTLDPQQIGFQNQLMWVVNELGAGYSDQLNGTNQLAIVLKDGTEYHCPVEANAASCAVLRVMGMISNPAEWHSWVMQEHAFQKIHARFFGLQVFPPVDMNSASQLTMLAPSDMRLPFGNGEAWYYTGGPHTSSAGGVSYSKAAIDFAPGGGSGCNWVSNSAVRAVKAGRVTYASCDMVKIDHGGNWVTTYFHLRNIAVSVGQEVAAGSILSYPSCNVGAACGWKGSASGVHVHFDVRYGNTPQRIQGMQFGGWTVNNGAADYNGTMVQGSTTKVASTTKSTNNELRAYEANVDTDDGRWLTSGTTIYGTRNPGTDEDIYYINASSGQQLTVEMWKHNSSLDTWVYVRDPNNTIIGTNDDSNATTNSRLSLTLSSSGRFIVVAKGFSSSTGGYGLKATLTSATSSSSGNWLQHNQILSARLNTNNQEDVYYFNGVAGRITSIRMWANGSSIDSYLVLYGPNGTQLTYNDDDHLGGTRNSWIAYTLPSTGVYRVKARSYRHSSMGAYQIRLRWIDANNLAQGRPVHTSSVESSSYVASRAVDGNNGTRWSSQFRDDQYIYVDLGSSQSVNMVTLRWETAYARRYGIYYWNGSRWVNTFWTDSGRGGTEIINFQTVNTRYVMMYAATRGTQWGISLWEFGVHNRATATVPLVIEDPDKVVDDINSEVPPAATSSGKDEMVVALSANENGLQESAPEEGTFDGSGTSLSIEGIGRPSAFIEAIHFDDSVPLGPETQILFLGNAVDNDGEGADPQIRAYEWTSSWDGVIGNTAEFTLKAKDLSIGTHTISFRAKDNEGQWSEYMESTVTIDHSALSKVLLPFIIK